MAGVVAYSQRASFPSLLWGACQAPSAPIEFEFGIKFIQLTGIAQKGHGIIKAPESSPFEALCLPLHHKIGMDYGGMRPQTLILRRPGLKFQGIKEPVCHLETICTTAVDAKCPGPNPSFNLSPGQHVTLLMLFPKPRGPTTIRLATGKHVVVRVLVVPNTKPIPPP